MSFEKIFIQSTVAVSRSKAWDMYTNPEHIVHWNFASDDWQCPSASNDMTIGGKYKARMEAKDGSWGFDFEAVYEAIDPEHSFTYVMDDGRYVAVVFTEENDKTTISITFDAENSNPIEMQKDGWQSILDNFTKYAESH